MYVTKTIANVPVAEFTDSLVYSPVKELSALITPSQDLHGYDKPWPGGLGKNLFNSSNTTSGKYIKSSDGDIGTSDSWSCSLDYTPVVPESIYTLSFANSVASSIAGYALYDQNFNYVSGHRYNNETRCTFTAPSNVYYIRASWNTADTRPPQLELGSTATAYEPYANICPITGWTGATVRRTGKNLLDTSQASFGLVTYISPNGNTVTHPGFSLQIPPGTYTMTGEKINPHEREYLYVYVNCADGSNYMVGYIAQSETGHNTGYKRTLTFTLNTSATLFYVDMLNGGYELFATWQTQLEKGDNSTAYEPYKGETLSIAFPTEAGTVYGGTLDVTRGLLTVEWGSDKITDPERLTGNTPTTFIFSPSSVPHISATVSNGEILFDRLSDGYYDKSNGKIVVYGRENSESAATFLARIGGELNAVYKLASPVIYQLTPQQLYTLPGQNIVFASTGNITITYIVNPLYLGRDFMINSGYVLLDGGGLDLSLTTAQTISGIWERTVSAINTGKPVWLYNTVYSETSEYTPIPVFIRFTSTTEITANAAGIVLTITSANTVTVTA